MAVIVMYLAFPYYISFVLPRTGVFKRLRFSIVEIV